MSKVKINVSIDDELLKEVDDYCDRMYLNRSYLISQQLQQVINMQKIINSISDLSFALKKAAEMGSIDEETERKMKEFETVAKILTAQ